jgi:hypothetical protein
MIFSLHKKEEFKRDKEEEKDHQIQESTLREE